MDDRELLALVNRLTLAEKASLCSGETAWDTKPLPQHGIPVLTMTDGPHGLRYEDFENAEANGGTSRPATCFPPACSQAAAFSPALCRRIGEAIAEEALAEGVGIVLGPGVNIKRSPLCGRNFEYYSEDPLLAGELAAGFIEGLQSKGVGASLKHFAANNQESWRMSADSLVDERALFDIYLRAFEIAVRKSQPATVMASYNKLGGTYACNSRRLLTDILRLRFGFRGAVISDWGAEFNRPAGVAAGLDLEMPGSAGVNDAEVQRAVQEGRLSEDALDTLCWNLLRLITSYAKTPAGRGSVDWDAHHELAVEAAAEGGVLLKNNDALLPLAPGVSLAVIGEMAKKPRYQGGGSSFVNPTRTVSFCEALDAAGQEYLFTEGYRGTETNDALLLNAVAAAKKADTVLLFLGLPDLFECEAYDRGHMALPESQLRLIDAVAAANPRLCVVLHCGSPVATPWLDKAQALLCMYLGGQGVGEATRRLLFGEVQPTGHLPESWPLQAADVPCAPHWPGGPLEAGYNESVYVGYRYYETAGKAVRFPFGFGLCYTQFSYSEAAVQPAALAAGGSVTASCRVKNTGSAPGEALVQCYASRPGSAIFRPARELVGFARVALAPGEEKTVSLEVPYDAFGHHDTASGQRVVEAGRCLLHLGPNSHELPLQAEVTLEGLTLHPDAAQSAEGPYGRITGNAFPDDAFAALYGRRPRSGVAPKRGEYNLTTPLGLTEGSFWGRRLLRLGYKIGGRFIHFSSDPEVNARAVRHMVRDMPLKNLVLQSEGRVSWRAARALVDLLNGRGSAVKVARLLGRVKK